MDDDGCINDYFIDDVLMQPTKMTQVIMHFAHCLKHQQQLETVFLDGVNSLKKQNALPQFAIGGRNSIFICKKGMRYVLKQYKKEIGDSTEEVHIDNNTDTDKRIINSYCGNADMDIFTFKKWLLRLFDIGDNGNFTDEFDIPQHAFFNKIV